MIGLSATATPTASRVGDDIRDQLRLGLAVVGLVVLGVGGWAATANLAGAVLAGGTVVVDSNVKKVQHPTGGVVGEIRVRDGDHVEAGDLLMRLDETVTRANLAIVDGQLLELAIRGARLRAEQEGLRTLELPRSLAARAADADVQNLLADERRLFEGRREARDGRRAQLRERIAQMRDEVAGFEAQRKAKSAEIALITQEVTEMHKLWVKNLVPLSKKIALERDAARLDGEHAQLGAAIAQARGRIAETELQILQVDQDMRSEVTRELRDLQAREAEYTERRVAAEDQLKRIELRAPQAGTVHQLSTHTVGGVISPSEPVMLIVPGNDALVVEARIAPQDIDHVRPGQHAFVRFTAFNQRTTPELDGIVQRVSADIARDTQQNTAYFVARISLSAEEMEKIKGFRLVPGMPAEVHIGTGDRIAASYFLKPLTDQIRRAFTEQ